MATLTWARVPPLWRWLGGVLALIVIVLIVLSLLDWNALRGPLARMASRHYERQITLDGPLRVRLFSATPSVEIGDLTIANPAWAGGGNLLQVHEIRVAIQLSQLFLGHLVLQTLEVEEPRVSLLRDESGRANWDLGKPTPPDSSPTKLPAIRHFSLRGGSLDVKDASRKLTFSGKVAASEGSSHDTTPFQLEGQGTLNKEPFKMTFQGGPLLNVQPDKAYTFQTTVDAGTSGVVIKGSIAKPFDFGVLDADIALRGQNLANLYYLTNLALPLTPPYQLSLRLHRADTHFVLDAIEGKIGSSDVHGHATIDLGQDARPRLTATLASHSLNLGDIGVAFGAGVAQQGTDTGAPQAAAPSKEPISPLLMPTFEFQFDRLKSMDAVVDFRADAVQTQKIPFKGVAFGVKLERGVMTVDPVDFELPFGKLAGVVRLDTTAKVPAVDIDVRLTDVHLDQFKGKGATQAPLDGILQSRARLQGSGNSVHAIAAGANGTLSAVVPQGEIREAFAELTGINIVRGLGLLLGKTGQTVPIRCGVAQFQLQNGDAHAERLIFDTENVLINGDGHITLGDEMLDLNLTGKPKHLRLGRLRAPINIRGTLRHPSIGISLPDTLKQGTVAAALGVVATPLAAVLAFIDPGLAKDANCAALVEDAQAKQ